MKTFADLLREKREAAGLSQYELSRVAGLHHQRIGTLEQGEALPHYRTMIAIARALSIHPGDLFPA
jgi:transcriptional regulator with XRE-family HTH domain